LMKGFIYNRKDGRNRSQIEKTEAGTFWAFGG